MKITLAQLNFHIGNFEGNVEKMLKEIRKAKKQGSDIICFPELAVTGYPPRDFLEFDDFIDKCEMAIDTLRQESDGIAIIVGAPSRNPVIEGKDLFNTAFFLYDQEIMHMYHKALLPTYDIFDEYRYFEPEESADVFEFKGYRIALTICEDIWNIGNENPLYTICPMDLMMPDHPDLMINISASPFSYDHAEERIHVLKANVERYGLPIFYVNQIGAQTEVIFDGGSAVMSPNGQIYEEFPYFMEHVETYDFDDVMASGKNNVQKKNKIQEIHDGIILGITDYFGKLGFKQAILGLSGGIDSAVTCALAVRALGKENVRGVLMPSEFSSDHSVNDARALAENLGIRYDVVPIEQPYQEFLKLLNPLFEEKPFNVAEENIQARCRGLILMALSNKHGNILLNTSNKSEMAVGYGTLYGDLAGGLSVLGDVYKTDVYMLAEYINQEQIYIPLNTINKPPSAELRPNQKDSDSLPEYDILDEILSLYIEQRLGPKEITERGHDEALVARILRLVNINEFKRYQTAPALRVSSKAFGMGRRMPIVGKYLA
ncbi:NAD+ synthase [Portibacter marinus]|uniref:NAD+ synthase n=1 Tax=Portibacter marinus TaxID=2898660 RepID=UPI001F16FABB|nr:NAD+ synthase [Portibacter marinus]